VQFNDDKSYPYLALSMGDEVPRIFITRKEKRPGLTYFGPFTHTWALRNTFDVILKVFPIRSCSVGNYERAKRTNRQCLLGDIGKCAAPCVGKVSIDEHRNIANRLIDFMGASNGDILPMLKSEMEEASTREEFERAAKIRDSIASIEKMFESKDAALPDDLSADLIAMYEEGLHAAGSIFIVRGGSIKGSRSWIVDQERALEGDDAYASLFFSIYSQSAPQDIPSEILLAHEPKDRVALEEWLSGLKGSKVAIKVPQRGEKVEMLATVARNAQYSLIQYLSKRATDAAVSGKALLEIEEQLELSRTPLRIECFDISNISGTSVVASMVVFEDGLAKKSEYRRFIIDTKEATDDTRAMHQVITRRMKRLIADKEIDQSEVNESGGRLSKFSYPPQLIVVDGGAPQVAAAQHALDELGVTNVALCGLAKRLEEVWRPGESDPLILSRTSEGMYLLQRVRDEAHRFAITFHRSRRSKVMLESLLDEIPQLGQSRRSALLDKFGSVTAIRAANVSELASTPGIGEKIAAIIFAHLATISAEKIDMQTGEITTK
jgi:excinuclease ABC subunit C